jgi:hypothetical protein
MPRFGRSLTLPGERQHANTHDAFPYADTPHAPRRHVSPTPSLRPLLPSVQIRLVFFLKASKAELG